ncbi:PQQ-binding-like beta-propeller repeat protein [Terriglobus sp. TAA 43]|uniref:outer membrane protein assembly factor BamB family protein n=1 Tax=Terriglobus sp. TAA 43 TaxID=278961 RepID=UPI00068A04E0|nr:PQQ-binding-like beta-propeller repeat protein [Terriglobus sp. TAA 43]
MQYRKFISASLCASATLMVALSSKHATTVRAEQHRRYADWSQFEGSSDASQYSSLRQVNKANVTQLQQAWFYPAGNNGLLFGSNPIVVDGVMFVLGRSNRIAALNAVTGKEIWVYDTQNPRGITNRGLTYWKSDDGTDARILFASNNELHALSAKSGTLITSFGVNGSVNLKEGLGRDPSKVRSIQSSTPGKIFGNLILMGSAPGEDYGSPPGDIRAYDVITGKLVWSFHTIPHPGEFGYDTWPADAWQYEGGVNTWGEFSIDENRGIAYFPLGSATYDFYGADRKGMNLFANCILALDAKTGKYLWHFQTVHHDLWDYDLAASPKLITVKHDGKVVDALAAAGKNGFLYVLDRVTGKPLWPIEERPVPVSTVPGEQSWPTQPFPTVVPPFVRQSFTADDINPYIQEPAERERLRKLVREAKNNGLFTPPALQNTIQAPGNGGGANWGALAADPDAGFVYVQAKNAPSLLKLEPRAPRRPIQGPPSTVGLVLYKQNCQACHLAEQQGQPPAIPSLKGVVERIGTSRVKETVHNGQSPMPAFADFTNTDLDALLAYLESPSTAKAPPNLEALLAPPPKTAGQRYWTGYGYMDSEDGLPAIKGPWSTLTAYDLNRGKIAWQVPLGGITRLEAKGIKGTGSYWPRGGVAVTAGGLIFSGTKSDSKFRAYDKDTGKVLWEKELPAAPEGIPAVYEVNGREYIVISARPGTVLAGTDVGAHQNSDGPLAKETSGDAAPSQGYYVFALPAKR